MVRLKAGMGMMMLRRGSDGKMLGTGEDVDTHWSAGKETTLSF